MTTFRASSKTTYFLLQILQLLHAYQPVTLNNTYEVEWMSSVEK